MSHTDLVTEAGAARASAERLIARYPDLEPEELAELLRFLRKEATAMDRATIASKPELLDRYRRLCREQHLDGIRPTEALVAVLGIAGLVMLVVVLSALADTI